MTRTVSGMTSSSRRISFTRRLPGSSTSRRGLRSTTFMSFDPARERLRRRESRRRLHLAKLVQVDAIVGGLEHPPLAQIEIAEAKVLERQPSWIDRGQPL